MSSRTARWVSARRHISSSSVRTVSLSSHLALYVGYTLEGCPVGEDSDNALCHNDEPQGIELYKGLHEAREYHTEDCHHDTLGALHKPYLTINVETLGTCADTAYYDTANKREECYYGVPGLSVCMR